MTHNGVVMTTKDFTFEDAWNSSYMQEIRQSMLDSGQYPGCRECWRMQKMGLRPMRHDSYDYGVPESQVQDPIKPMRVEFNSSNVCNLKCRICSSSASTQWIKEARELYNFHDEVHNNLTPTNLEQAKNWADNFVEIGLYGGEPLLSQENIEFLKYLIEKDLAKDIEILGNTNATVWNDEIEEILSHFKKVKLGFSIDDIGKRFEYQRKNAKWEDAVANMKRAYAFAKTKRGKNYIPATNFSLSIFNIYYFPEYHEYFAKEFPGWQMHWNLVFDPWYYSAQILPNEVKEVIKDRILNNIPEKSPLIIGQNTLTSELLTFLEWTEEHFNLDEFFRTINRHDVYRDESYPEVFPEMWELIKAYKPADLIMGQYDEPDRLRIAELDLTQNPTRYLAYHRLTQVRKEWLSHPVLNGTDTEAMNDIILEGLTDVHGIMKMDDDFESKIAVWRDMLTSEDIDLAGFYSDFFEEEVIDRYRAVSGTEVSEMKNAFIIWPKQAAAPEQAPVEEKVEIEVDYPDMSDKEAYPSYHALKAVRRRWQSGSSTIGHAEVSSIVSRIVPGLKEIHGVMGLDQDFEHKMEEFEGVIWSEETDYEAFFNDFFNTDPMRKYAELSLLVPGHLEENFHNWFGK